MNTDKTIVIIINIILIMRYVRIPATAHGYVKTD